MNSPKISPTLLIVLLSLCPLTILKSSTNWANGITVSTSTSCNNSSNGCIKFSAVVPAVMDNYSIVRRAFKYIWFFGDGSYKSGVFTFQCPATEGTLTVEHTYSSTYSTQAYPQPYLEIMMLCYDDDKEPKKIAVPTTPNGTNPNATPEHIPEPSTPIDIIHYLSPRANEVVTYVFSVLYECGKQSIFDIGFNKSLCTVEEVFIPGHGTVSTSAIANANASGNLFLTFPQLPNRRVNCFVRFRFDSSVDINKTLTFSATLRDDTTIEGYCNSFPARDMLTLQGVNSHDPNQIVAKSSLCLKQPLPTDMTYSIIFENIGDGPATTVIVEDILPDCFLFNANSIQVSKPAGIQNSTNHFSLNMPTRKIRWVLDHQFLKKEVPRLHNQLMAPNDNLQDAGDTRDTIIFTVQFDPTKPLVPCGAIVNQAEITFLPNPAMMTNLFSTSILCDTTCDTLCVGAYQAPRFSTVSTVKGVPLTLNLGTALSGGESVEWYPSHDLSDPHSPSPIATPETTTTYTAIVSKGCTTQKFQIKVVVNPAPNSWWKYWWWLVLFLLGLFGWKKWRERVNPTIG